MGQTVVFAIGGGILAGMLFLSAAFGSPGALITTLLTPLPLFVVGLSLGAAACILAGIIGALVVGLIVGPVEMAGFAAGAAVPFGLMVYQAVTLRQDGNGVPRWTAPGSLLLWVVGYAAASIAAAAVVSAAYGSALQTEVHAGLAQQTPLFADLSGGDGAAVVEPLSRFFPAMMAGTWIVATVLNAALAQWLVHRFELGVRPPIGMADIELPGWPVAILAGLAALAFLASGQIAYAAQNVALALALAFFIAGLGVVHGVLRGRASRPLLLIVFYTAVVWQGIVVVPAVAALGIIERWAGIRRRMAATGPDLEDE